MMVLEVGGVRRRRPSWHAKRSVRSPYFILYTNPVCALSCNYANTKVKNWENKLPTYKEMLVSQGSLVVGRE